MDSRLHTRLKEFIDHKGLNINEFSRKTGFSSGSLSKILNGKKNFGVEKLMNIFISFPELKAQWLLLGEGEMIANPEVEQKISLEYVSQLERQVLQLNAKVETLQEVVSQLMNRNPPSRPANSTPESKTLPKG